MRRTRTRKDKGGRRKEEGRRNEVVLVKAFRVFAASAASVAAHLRVGVQDERKAKLVSEGTRHFKHLRDERHELLLDGHARARELLLDDELWRHVWLVFKHGGWRDA